MISRLFASGSATAEDLAKLRKDTCAQVDALIKELELIKKENKLLTEMLSEHQLSINILITANQNLMEDLGALQSLLTKSAGGGRKFSFTFRDNKDDDLPN